MAYAKSMKEYLKDNPWLDEIQILRKILAEFEVEETIKWGMPIYTYKGENLIGIGAFKNYFGLWFYQGVFLKDKRDLLHNAQKGKTMALRQFRMNSKSDIDRKVLASYIKETLQNHDKGMKMIPKRNEPIVLPQEWKDAFANNKKLEKAFNTLSKGKQREYAEHVGTAKRETTRLSRIEKCIPMVLAQISLHEKYK